MKPNQRNVLLIGYDEHLCMSVLYCLRKVKGYNFYVLTTKARSSAKYSRHVKGVLEVQGYDAIEQGAIDCIKNWDIDLLMPFGEKEGLAVATAYDRLSKICRIMPLTELKNFKIATNKKNLNNFLLERGLELMPQTLDLDDPQFKEKFKELKYPTLHKPAEGAFGAGIRTVKDKTEAVKLLSEDGLSYEGTYFQQYVNGSDINCNVICKDGEIKHYTIQESPLKSLGNYNKNDDLVWKEDEKVLEVVRPMLKELNYQGVACIDLRRDVLSGQVYLLEVNARFWGSLMASLTRARVNFPLIMLKMGFDEDAPAYEKRNGEQMSIQTFIKQLLRFKWPKPSLLKFWPYLSDPRARFMKYWIQKF